MVIVNDPTKPPTQDNIKQIVEMKFPPDAISERQEAAYIKIAGDAAKLKILEPGDCGCDTPEPEVAKLPIEKLGWVASVAAWVAYVLTRGRTPRPPLPAI